MASSAGIDLMRGRPTPAIGSTEAKLQQRKLDALRRGIHRIVDPDTLAYGLHFVGIGAAGTAVIEQVLRDAPADMLDVDGSRMTALSVDMAGNAGSDLLRLSALAARFPAERVQVETVSLTVPSVEELLQSQSRLNDALQLEYPLSHAGAGNAAWLPSDLAWPRAGEPMPRALAKAVYTRAYYDADRPMAAALRRFARSVEQAPGDVVVCIVFALGSGTGSGIALDLARHLSNVMFGRRVLVTGIGIAPCEGDADSARGAGLFAALNEIDVLCDESKNKGVVLSCGDLYKNPFTAGFLVVPQQPAWLASRDLQATHRKVDEDIASMMTLRHGANLWEVLRLLNWVAAPSTQHSAARTPWGSRWLHLHAFADVATDGDSIGPGFIEADAALVARLGLLPSYTPEFIEMRVGSAAQPFPEASADRAPAASINRESTAPLTPAVQALVDAIDGAFHPEVAPAVAYGGKPGRVQFTLPRVAKTDLDFFHAARDAYDASPAAARLLGHAMLLDRGVWLSEPSTRLEGMAGASVGDSAQWIAVPLADLRGESVAAERTPAEALELATAAIRMDDSSVRSPDGSPPDAPLPAASPRPVASKPANRRATRAASAA